jgi:hypothetical protein
MAFFRTFLIENDQTPDTTFSERDEAALILFLLQARLRRRAIGLRVPEDFEAPEELPQELEGVNVQKELKFLAGFRCFFVSKPHGYEIQMAAFLDYFVPDFARDVAKQIQLAEGMREAFYSATLEDLKGAKTLDRFFNVNAIGRASMLVR